MSSMWNPINIPVWLLGSKLKRAESFCAQRGGILSSMRQKHARSCQVLFWTLWSNNHAALIFSPLIMQCNLKKRASWVPEDDLFLPEASDDCGHSGLHLHVFGMQLSPVKSKASGGLVTRAIYCYILVKNTFTPCLLVPYTTCCVLGKNCSPLIDVFLKDHKTCLCPLKWICFVWAQLYCFSVNFHQSARCMWTLIWLAWRILSQINTAVGERLWELPG